MYFLLSDDPFYNNYGLYARSAGIITTRWSQLQARTNYRSVSSTVYLSFRALLVRVETTDRVHPGTVYYQHKHTTYANVDHGIYFMRCFMMLYTAHLRQSHVRPVCRFLHTLSSGWEAGRQLNYLPGSYRRDLRRTTLLNINTFSSLRIFPLREIPKV